MPTRCGKTYKMPEIMYNPYVRPSPPSSRVNPNHLIFMAQSATLSLFRSEAICYNKPAPGATALLPEQYQTCPGALVFMKTIPLNNGKETLVDDEDYPELSKYKWCCSSGNYAIRHKGKMGESVFMHREILGLKRGENMVDHVDRDGLNNQRSNLRLCTISQNAINRRLPNRNKSGYRGVHWNKAHDRWRSTIRFEGKQWYVGEFKD